MPPEYLFSDKDLGTLIRSYPEAIRKEVEGWERNRILGASEEDLVEFLVEKYTLHPPSIRREEVHIDSEGEALIDVQGRFDYHVRRGAPITCPWMYVTIAIPFDGDADLFSFRANTYSSPPAGRVDGQRILVTFRDVKLNPDQVKQELDGALRDIETALGWTKNDCDVWNNRVRGVAEQAIKTRKARLLEQSNMVAALGLPMRRRPDAPQTFAMPIKRRARPVALPPFPKGTFQPEPELPETEYDYILGVVEHLAQAMERSASTFAHMGEEQIRDLLIVDLNGHYEGAATGETFNAEGKTDILIRANGRNAFIAECKFWNGPKSLLSAIDQVLGYLTWRDTKAAVIIFSKNVEFTTVLDGIRATVPTHPNHKRDLRKVSETHCRCLFRQRDDPARDLYLAFLAFNVPRA